MQFNFWWFTSNAGTNIIIATVIWFFLFVICQKMCSKEQETHPLVYIGYAIASFGAGLYSVAGVSSAGLLGAGIALIGFILVMIIGFIMKPKYTSSSDFRDLPSSGRSVEEDIPTSTCPDCGAIIKLTGGIVKPDGSVVCTKCMKKFMP